MWLHMHTHKYILRKNSVRKGIKILTGIIFGIEFQVTFTFFFMLSDYIWKFYNQYFSYVVIKWKQMSL